MSEVRVNKLSPRSGTTVTLGDSGDTITIPSGVTLDASSGGLAGTLTTAAQPNITSVGTLTSFTSTGIDDNATSTAITIDSSEQVGINTTSPQAPLHIIDGNGSVSGASYRTTTPLVLENNANTELQFFSNSSNNGQIRFGDGDTNFAGGLTYFHSNDVMAFATNTLERMRIDSSGYVGIGTSSPQGNLSIEGEGRIVTIGDSGAANVPEIRSRNIADTGNAFLRISSYATQFYTEGTQRMYIDPNGNVGIGTTVPASLLHIDGTNPKITVGTSGSNVTFLQRVSDDFYIYNRESAGDLLFGTSDTERMRIDSSGNVGIGTSSPSEKLEVSGNILITNNNALKINDTSGAKEILKVDNFNQTI